MIRGQDDGQTGVDKVQLLPCQEGDLVTGVSMLHETSVGEMVWCIMYYDGLRMEGAVPRISCSPCDPYEFMLQMSVAPEASLGLRGSAHPHGLEVDGVKPGGIIDKWNKACALAVMRNALRRGDVIVSANGCQDSASMLASLRRSSVARLSVVRFNDGRAIFGVPPNAAVRC